MRPTTIAKIGAGDRLLRFNKAVGIADMFEVSVDFLLGRNGAANRSELTYRLRVFLDAAEQSPSAATPELRPMLKRGVPAVSVPDQA
jgi:hypothetical protein